VASGQRRVTRVGHDVRVVLTGLDEDTRERLHLALHRADRRLGVVLHGRDFVLLTQEPDEESARGYVRMIVAEAAELAGISPDEVAQAPITEVVRRVSNRTGEPRRVTAPAGTYRTVDLGALGRLRALHEGPLGEWIVERESDGAWAGRNLLSVLTEVFDLPWGRKDAWVHDLIGELEGRRTPLGVRYPCPCCDFLTLVKSPSTSFEICPVCWWENDSSVQLDDMDYAGGPNKPSLREARATYQRIGACEPRLVAHARAPLPEERRS
jgi:hypothetical protein